MVIGRIGVSASARELWAVNADSGVVLLRAPLDPFSNDANQWPSLVSAFREMARLSGTAGAVLSVALAAPLAEVRALELPALKEDELRAVITRGAQRYFVGARGAQLVGVAALGKRSAGEPVLTAAASQRMVFAIHAAARDAGLTIDTIVPAESAWAGAAKSIWPALGQKTGHLIVAHADRTVLVQLRDGRLHSVRKFRAGAADASVIAEAIGATAERVGAASVHRVAAIGHSDGRRELTRALSSAGVTVNGPTGPFAEAAGEPERLAATFAASAADLAFRSDDDRAVQQQSAKRVALYLSAAAVVLLVLSAGLALWGVRRQLNAVANERAALRPQLSTTLVGRTSVETAYRQLAALNVAERAAPQWTVVLVRIADHLDVDSYLTSFRGRGDSVVVEGIADHAAKVFTDLEETPGLTNIRAAAPVRREAPNGAEATQRFTIAAHLSPPPTPPAATAKPTTAKPTTARGTR
ncbi:MAG: PilN domain-containing protein [Gemmatimonadota bacterium]